MNSYNPITLKILFFCCFIFPVLGEAQPPVQWDRTFGGSNYEELHAIAPAEDGGFIFGGATYSDANGDIPEASRGESDYWLVRTDSEGVMQWNKRFGGEKTDLAWTVIQTMDGGYLIGGNSNSNVGGDKTNPTRGENDYWLVKVDKEGAKEWDMTIGGEGDDQLRGGIVQTKDGGYLLAGFSNSNASGEKSEDSKGGYDYWIVKTDFAGNVEWDRTYGGAGDDQLFAIKNTFSDGYIIGGFSTSGITGDKTAPLIGVNDYWVLKLKGDGEIVWDRTYGGDNEDVLLDIEPTEDGSFLIGGFSKSGISGNKSTENYGDDDFWLIKVNPNGNEIWDLSFGGEGKDRLFDIRETRSGNYAIGGLTRSDIHSDRTENDAGNDDFWLIYLEPDGNVIWDEVYGGSNRDALSELDIAADGGFIMAGQSASDVSGDKTENSRGPDNFENDFWIIKTACGQPELIGNDTTLCQNGLLTINATIPNCEDCTYRWQDGSIEPVRIIFPKEDTVYKVRIIDPNGCVVEDSVKATVLPIPVGAATTTAPPDCFGDENGFISIDEIMGGTQPYQYSLNEQETSDNPDFYNLGAGNYTLKIEDSNGCVYDTLVYLQQPNQLTLTLGEDHVISLGDSVLLRILTNQELAEVKWSQQDLLNCQDPACLNAYVRPLETIGYSVRVTNEKGCIAQDNIVVGVSKERPIYFPTAFTPDDDGANDYFGPHPGAAVTSIRNFQIFDRWGQLVYEQKEIEPNNLPLGWDGNFRGKPMNPGVFYWYAEIEFLDEWSEQMKGTITLLR